MNALNIYLNTLRYVMLADYDNRESWVEIYRYIPYLRESLSCYVCKHIANQPMGRGYQVCQHFVCKDCIGGRMKLKPQCSWCKDYMDFRHLEQLKMVAICFRKLCDFITRTPIYNEIQMLSESGCDNDLKLILREGCKFKDGTESEFNNAHTMVLPPSFSSLPVPDLPVILTSPQIKEVSSDNIYTNDSESAINTLPIVNNKSSSALYDSIKKTRSNQTSKSRFISGVGDDQYESSDSEKEFSVPTPRKSIYHSSTINNNIFQQNTVSYDKAITTHTELYSNTSESMSDSDTSAEIDVTGMDKIDDIQILKNESNRGIYQRHNLLTTFEEESSCKTNIKQSKFKSCAILKSQKSKSSKFELRHGLKLCKCGRGGTNSRLTCLGQRCPCYINKLPCVACKCKGCRNPRKMLDVSEDLKFIESEMTDTCSFENNKLNSENIFVS